MRRRGDGRYELVLPPELRATIRNLLDQLDELLDGDPGQAELRRLSPPAYLEHPDRDAEYQLLAGEELRTSRREAIAAVTATLDRDDLSEEELWAWLRSLNALRLVVGTSLGIEDEEHTPVVDPADPDAERWAVYDFATWLQHGVVLALG